MFIFVYLLQKIIKKNIFEYLNWGYSMYLKTFLNVSKEKNYIFLETK